MPMSTPEDAEATGGEDHLGRRFKLWVAARDWIAPRMVPNVSGSSGIRGSWTGREFCREGFRTSSDTDNNPPRAVVFVQWSFDYFAVLMQSRPIPVDNHTIWHGHNKTLRGSSGQQSAPTITGTSEHSANQLATTSHLVFYLPLIIKSKTAVRPRGK